MDEQKHQSEKRNDERKQQSEKKKIIDERK